MHEIINQPITRKNRAPHSYGEISRQKWLTMKEACIYYKMSKPTIINLIKQGRLLGICTGKWTIGRETSDELLKNTEILNLKK